MNFVISHIGHLLYKLSKLNQLLIGVYLQRHYARHMAKMGQGVQINKISHITGLEKIEIGDNVIIGENAYIRGEGGLSIGSNCHISRNLVIYTHNHNYEGTVLPYDDSFRYRRVIIEKNVWLGMNVMILPGAHIKEGAIVGAGSVVAGVVEPLTIVGAPIAQPLKQRDREHYERLDREKRYGGPNGVPL